MRRDGVRARWMWGVALVCVSTWSGCKKQEEAPAPASPAPSVKPAAAATTPTPPPTPPAPPAEPVDAAHPLRYSAVKLSHEGPLLKVSYTLANAGTTRVRGVTCVWLHDGKGAFIESINVGAISLKGGDSDTFEDKGSVEQSFWTQVRSVQVFAAASNCTADPEDAISGVLHVTPSGQPVPAGTPKPVAEVDTTPGTPAFALSDVDLTQNPRSGEVHVTYTVKNLTPHRANGGACVRVFSAENRALDEDNAGDFSLPPGSAETLTDEVVLDLPQQWGTLASVEVMVGRFGCADTVQEAISNVVRFDKPSEIRRMDDEDLHADEVDVAPEPDEAMDSESDSDDPEDSLHADTDGQ